jgi:hypothetical protein
MLTRTIAIAFACLTLLATSKALAVFCGSTPLDSRFDAVCGLAPRAWVYDETWRPEGSGTYVQWTDPQNVQRVGIITVQHFLDGNPNPSGDCTSQVGLWYAYFRGCSEACPNCPCANVCMGVSEDITRVRITCFRLATLPYREITFGLPDGVVIGEIEPCDLSSIAHITPIQIDTPYNLDLCTGQMLYLAGWGRTRNVPCGVAIEPENEAKSLHVGLSSITSIGCFKDGRSGGVSFAPNDENPQTGCGLYGGVSCHDSGGAALVEGPGGSLRLIGVLATQGVMFFAARHQEISDPDDPTFIRRPCRPEACGDIDGDPLHLQDCDDAECLDALDEWPVNPWCLGDMDGDGIAGTKVDVNMIKCDPGGNPNFCDRNQWCWGDANLDGYVNSTDIQLVRDIRAQGTAPDFSVSCNVCAACPPLYEWCRGDVNFDGVVDAEDETIVDSLDGVVDGAMHLSYRCFQGAPGCEPPDPCPPPPVP